MSGRELKNRLKGAGVRVRVKDGVNEHLIDCHSRKHARQVAAAYVRKGKTAFVEPSIH